MNKLKQQRKERNLKDKEWKEAVRKRDGNICQVSGKGSSECKLNTHHILPKEIYPEFRHDIWNGITLSFVQHKGRVKSSAHRDPIGFFIWLLNNKPQQLEEILKNIKNSSPNRFSEFLEALQKASHPNQQNKPQDTSIQKMAGSSVKEYILSNRERDKPVDTSEPGKAQRNSLKKKSCSTGSDNIQKERK